MSFALSGTEVAAWESAALAALGVLVAETLEALRLYVSGDGREDTHRWPKALALTSYLVASGLRLALGVLVALSLFALGMACSGTLSFLSGIATLKVVEVVFGYAGTAEA